MPATSKPNLSKLGKGRFYWVKLNPYERRPGKIITPEWEPMQLSTHRETNKPCFNRAGVLYQFPAEEIEAVGPVIPTYVPTPPRRKN